MYLDHAATTPLRPEARAAMEEGFAIWANPSSPHAEGRKAKNALEDARDRVKKSLGWDGEVIFTSGASEAAALAIAHAKVDRRAVSAVEHDAVFLDGEGSFDSVMPVGENGRVSRGEIYEALAVTGTSPNDGRPTTLLCQQHVNSETGACFNVSGMHRVLGNFHGCLMLSDCSQSAGKLELPSTDMAIVSAHKLGGPIGIGALLVRDYALLNPTGGHERGYRRGTENLPGAMGFAAALDAGGWLTTAEQREAFFASLGDARLSFAGQVDYIGAVAHPTISAQALLIKLDAMGIAVSAGSACSSGTLKKSRVLDAFGIDDKTAKRTIRVSIGWNTTQQDLERFSEAWVGLT
nr:aminotransferase class V-fold PLP-dependent enzyme [Parerythrobacter jejuensis]